jgi:hypothetical protein
VIQAGGNSLCSEVHKLIDSLWNNEKLPQQWKIAVTVPINKKGDKTNYSNHGGI